MRYLVCENREPSHNTAVLHIEGKCSTQRDPGVVIATNKTYWFGYYKTLGDAIEKAMKSGRRHVKKCNTCFR